MQLKKYKISALAVILSISLLPLAACGETAQSGYERDRDADLDGFSVSELSALQSGATDSEAGLSDIYAVGLNETAFQERQYDIGSIGSGATVKIDAADYGLCADDGKDDSHAIYLALQAAAALDEDTVKVITLSAGEIDLVQGCGDPTDYGYAIVMSELKNVVIDGQGADIVICGDEIFGFVNANYCENILFTDFTVDCARSPYVMGVVQSFDPEKHTVTVSVNSGYTPDPDLQVIQYVEYDPIRNYPKADGNFFYTNDSATGIKNSTLVKNGDQYSYVLTYDPSSTYNKAEKFTVGTKVALGYSFYGGQQFYLDNNSNVYVENVSIYSGWGMGVRAYSNENLYFNRFNVQRRPNTDRLFTVAADAFHFKNTRGEIMITNSILEYSHDDAVNVSNSLYEIYSVDASTGAVVCGHALGEWNTFRPKTGDVFEILDRTTLTVLKTVTADTVEYAEGNYVVTFKEGDKAVDASVFQAGKQVLQNISTAAKFTFTNNIVRNKRNRGLLIETQNCTIANNLFSNIKDGAIVMTIEVNEFNEGAAPRNVIIENNKFLYNSAQNGYGDIQIASWNNGPGDPSAISKIAVRNNFFAYSYNAVISMRGCSEIAIENNLMYEVVYAPVSQMFNCVLYLMTVDQVSVKQNMVIKNTEGTNFSPVYTTGDMGRVELDGNEGLDTVISDVLQNLQVSSVESVAVDGDLSDWAEQGTQVALNSSNYGYDEVDLTQALGEDFDVTFKIGLGTDGFYFSADVTDDTLIFYPATNWWLADFVEVFLSTDTTSSDQMGSLIVFRPEETYLQLYMHGIGTYNLDSSRTSASLIDGYHANSSLIDYAMVTTQKGYAVEGFISWELIPDIKAALNAGEQIAFSFTIGDRDDESESDIAYYTNVFFPSDPNKYIPSFMQKIYE